ncbi:MAG TPA: phosphatidylglycerol lysyltransferase domain-containing protein [Candidatus Saccharimonadales bacterium]|nr:phosphatidylglycerol lysyltransferase domain-containing protein [Candidatus Saccharimonadales bacterium]
MRRLRDWFGVVWLPVYVLAGTSWLLAPLLAHQHYGTLVLISNSEAGAAGGWFRLGDVLAGLVLLAAVWQFGLMQRARWVGWVVGVIAVLSIIDGLFPDTCYIGHQLCTTPAAVLSAVHDVETVVLTALLAVLSLWDAVRNRRLASIGFVTVQLLAACLVVSGLASTQFRVVLQYAYEFAAIIWLGWLVDGYNRRAVPARSAWRVRRAAGLGMLLAGLLAIIASLPHLRFVHDQAVLHVVHTGSLLAQHGIIAGVLLLYLSRHLLRGERPVLWLGLLVVGSLVLKYSVLTPHVLALVVYGLLFTALLYARASFDRNLAPPSWAGRLKDIGVVFGGVAVALTIGLVAATLLGHRPRLVHDVSTMYDYSQHVLERREDRLQARTEARLRVLAETLVVSLGAVTLWSLFRPKRLGGGALEKRLGKEHMEYLLQRYSNSSEDYFKLWPEGKSYFVHGGAAIAYRVEGGIAFMLADPVGPEQERAGAVAAFIGHARGRGWTVCALLIGGKPRELYEAAGLKLLRIGSSAVVDVSAFCNETANTKWWRWQRNRAGRSGLQYAEAVPPHNPETMRRLRQVSDAWVGEKGRSEQGFALGYFDEAYLQACRLHLLSDADGQLVAFANELPVFAGSRQATVDLIRHLPAEPGVMSVLLMHVIQQLQTRGFASFDLGFVPLAQVDNEFARLLRRVSASRFSAQGLEQFKNKFDPVWHPDYLAYDGDLIDLARIAANLERLFAVNADNSKS